jgi:hypothetical protein
MTRKRETLADLRQMVSDLEAQIASRCSFACGEVERAGGNLAASAAILEIRALGGRVIVNPVAIRDGLSPETIAAIQNDLRRSYALATISQPKEARHGT